VVGKGKNNNQIFIIKVGLSLLIVILMIQKNIPFPSVSNKLKAWRSSSISSSVMLGLEVEDWDMMIF
jgi:hypothetical protein